MKYPRYYIIGLLLLLSCPVAGQDVVFNHPYAGMLYTNPAYTGIFGTAHAGVTYRNQYAASPSPYQTYYAEADAFIDSWGCAFGAFILNTQAAGGQLKETGIGLSYMYNIKISEDLEVKPAIQAIFHNKQRDFQSYTFPDRIDITGTAIPVTAQDYEPYNVNTIDFAAGAIAQFRQLEAGFSVQHIGAQSSGNDPATPFKALVHAKYILNLNRNKVSSGDVTLSEWASFSELKLIPYAQFIYQQDYQYITAGAILQSGALFLGGGIKTALKQEVANLSLSAGFVTSSLRIGYSADFIAFGSTLNGWSGMSHEIFLHYSFGNKESQNSNKWRKQSSCGCYL